MNVANMFSLLVLTVVILLSFVFTQLSHSMELTENQQNYIKKAYDYGQNIIYNGERYGETVASILFQESKANWKGYQKNGLVYADGKEGKLPKSLGPMMVTLGAAKDVQQVFPSMFAQYFDGTEPSDAEIVLMLLLNPDFNIECGSKYFKLMLIRTNGNYKKALLAYNAGIGATVDVNDYVNKVIMWRKTVIGPFLKGSKQ